MPENTKKSQISDHIRLPIGYEMDGVRYRNVIIDELMGIDDHLVIGKKAGKNAAKASTMVLCRTIQAIEGVVDQKKNPESLIDRSILQKMYGPDRDFVLSRVYLLSGREESVMAGECPRCHRVWEEEIPLQDLPVIEWPDDKPCYFEFELDVGVPDPITGEKQKFGKIEFPTGKIHELAGELDDPADTIDAMLGALIKDLGTMERLTKEQVKRMKSRDRNILIEKIANDFPGVQMLKIVNCECGREYEARADLTAFFGGQRRRAKG